MAHQERFEAGRLRFLGNGDTDQNRDSPVAEALLDELQAGLPLLAIERRTKTFDRIVVDQEISLKRWALLLERFLGRVPLAWVFANNHFAGHAPATIRTLAQMVGRE